MSVMIKMQNNVLELKSIRFKVKGPAVNTVAPQNAHEHITTCRARSGRRAVRGSEMRAGGGHSVALQKFRGVLILTYSSIPKGSPNVRMG